MARTRRSVRVDPGLLADLEDLARQRLVPASFSDQVDAGLRLLVHQAGEEQAGHAAGLVGADRRRAEQTYRRLHRRRGGWPPAGSGAAPTGCAGSRGGPPRSSRPGGG